MVHTFSKGISPKENEIAWLKFKLTFCDITVQDISHYDFLQVHRQTMKK